LRDERREGNLRDLRNLKSAGGSQTARERESDRARARRPVKKRNKKGGSSKNDKSGSSKQLLEQAKGGSSKKVRNGSINNSLEHAKGGSSKKDRGKIDGQKGDDKGDEGNGEQVVSLTYMYIYTYVFKLLKSLKSLSRFP
jgi:hypothetical protein